MARVPRPRRLRKLALPLLAASLSLSLGCFRTTALMPAQTPADTHTFWTKGFFWGAVGETVDAGRICGGRQVASVSTDRSAGNIVVGWVTLGLYTPSRMSVTCAQPPSYGYAQPYAQPYYTPPYGYAQPSAPTYPGF